MSAAETLKDSNEQAANELVLFAINDSILYKHAVSIIDPLKLKVRREKYNADKALILWQYHAEVAAKAYVKAFGSDTDKWHEMFNVQTRKLAAKEFAEYYHEHLCE